MFVTRKAFPRRTMLRELGASLALRGFYHGLPMRTIVTIGLATATDEWIRVYSVSSTR